MSRCSPRPPRPEPGGTGGGWWLTSGGMTYTKGESALTLVETIRGNNGMDEHPGGGGGKPWLTDHLHADIPLIPMWSKGLWREHPQLII